MVDVRMVHLLRKLLVVTGSVFHLMVVLKLGIVCWVVQRKYHLKRIRKWGYKFQMKRISDVSEKGIDAYFERI